MSLFAIIAVMTLSIINCIKYLQDLRKAALPTIPSQKLFGHAMMRSKLMQQLQDYDWSRNS